MVTINVFNLYGEIFLRDNNINKDLEKVEKSGNKVDKTFGEMAKNIGKWGGIAGAAILSFAGVVGGLAVKSSDELTKSLNGIKAATGYTDVMMTDMKDTMLSIYNNNFGADFEDIGKAMETIGKATGLTGKELQKATENALLMRDTFEFEVNESLNSSQMLMTQFGISADEAYNLIAQGAQWGLDKNGDLLDTINEYSVQFAQAGFSSEEMFNMFQNGAIGGVINADKIGDSIKEFTIRAKDGSDATNKAFADLGLNAEKTSIAFAKGGEAGRKAFDEVNMKILEMKDPLKQNEIGVALYGTMWEDVGIKGIKALADTRGEISLTTTALEDINKIKYNTVGEAFEGIKRNLETSITIPLGEKILPKLSEFGQWITDNMPQIQAKIQETMDAGIIVFDKFSDAVKWAKDNSDWLIPVLAGVVSGLVSFNILTAISGLINTWRTGTLAATIAQGGLNAVLAANPFGAAALVIGVLVAAGIALWKNWDTVTAKATVLKNNIKTKFDEIKLAITTPINAAVETVRQKIQAIKDFFSKLVLNIPKPKLPHFSISGKFDLIPPDISVPKLGVDWYAKGTDNFKGGLAGINEYGKGEIVNLPNGSQIIPHDISKEMAKGSGQANIVIENMNVRNDNDIKLIARELYNLQQNKNRALGVV